MSAAHIELHKRFFMYMGVVATVATIITGIIVVVYIFCSVDTPTAEAVPVRPKSRWLDQSHLSRENQIKIMVDCIMDADETCKRARKRDSDSDNYWTRAGKDQMKAAVAAAFFAYRTGVWTGPIRLEDPPERVSQNDIESPASNAQPDLP